MLLLCPEDLASLLVFESLTQDWVREVHTYNSKRKRGKTFVIFRNYRNKTVSTLEELRLEFDDATFLDNISFKSGQSHDIVSNKVGAGKIARKAARKWMEESAKRSTENITKPEVKYRHALTEKASVNKDIGTRQPMHTISETQNLTNDLKHINKKQEGSPILRDTEGFLAPTQPLLAQKKLSEKDKYHIIEQQTNDALKAKELVLSEEERGKSENKKPSHPKKICTNDAESETPKNEEIINKDDNLLQNKVNTNIFQKPHMDFQKKVSDFDFDTDSDSEETIKENEQAILIQGKAPANVLFQTCSNEPAVINQSIPDSYETKSKEEPGTNLNLSLNKPSHTGRHDHIGSLDDDESEEESIKKGIAEEIKSKPSRSAENLDETKLKDEQQMNIYLPLSDSSDVWMQDYIGSMDDDESEEESIKEDIPQDIKSKPAESAEDPNTTILNDESKLNIHLPLSDSSDAWMHDYIGSMDDDESEEESGSEEEIQFPIQSNQNYKQLETPLKDIPNTKIGHKNILQTFCPENDDLNVGDIKDLTFNPTSLENFKIENKNDIPSDMTKEKQILINESTKNELFSLPLHGSSDAWMAEDQGSMADDDDSEEDKILERKKALPLQISNQTDKEDKETQQERSSQKNTKLVDVLQRFQTESDREMDEPTASNKYTISKEKDDIEDVKDEYTSCLPLKDTESTQENKNTSIEEEKTETVNLHRIKHTAGGSHDRDENRTGLIDVLSSFLNESNNKDILDSVSSENEIKIEEDIIKEYEDLTKQDRQDLEKNKNDQTFSFEKEGKNAADAEDNFGNQLDSEEVIPPQQCELIDVLKTFIADSGAGDVPKLPAAVLEDATQDEQDVYDPNIEMSKQEANLQSSVDADQSDSDDNSSSDNIFDYGTEDSDLGSSDCPTDPESDFENESKEDSKPAKHCPH